MSVVSSYLAIETSAITLPPRRRPLAVIDFASLQGACTDSQGSVCLVGRPGARRGLAGAFSGEGLLFFGIDQVCHKCVLLKVTK